MLLRLGGMLLRTWRSGHFRDDERFGNKTADEVAELGQGGWTQ